MPADSLEEMVGPRRHDLYALFAFALREHDWPLATAIAAWSGQSPSAHRRLALEVKQASAGIGAPRDLKQLGWWSALAKDLEPAGGTD